MVARLITCGTPSCLSTTVVSRLASKDEPIPTTATSTLWIPWASQGAFVGAVEADGQGHRVADLVHQRPVPVHGDHFGPGFGQQGGKPFAEASHPDNSESFHLSHPMITCSVG